MSLGMRRQALIMQTSLPQRDSDDTKLRLSQDDITRLLNEDAPGIRVDVLQKVADGYEQTEYGEQETAVAEQIFRTLVRDTEQNVRIALAERFKDSAAIPRDIIQKLVKDENDAVAVPLMASSPLLSEQDLLSIIESTPVISLYLIHI